MATASQAVQAVLEYLEDLFGASPNDSFTRDEVLLVISAVKHDPEILERLKQLDPN